MEVRHLGAGAIFADLPFPCALISNGSGQRDPGQGESNLRQEEFRITLLQVGEGDRFGEGALVSAALADEFDSDGRGVLEFGGPLDSAIGFLNESVRMQFVGSSPAVAEWFGDVNIAAWRHTFTAQVDAQPGFAPPRRLRVTASGGGSISLAWDAAPTARYDFLAHRLVRKAGGSPPASEADGVVVFTGSGTSFVDTVAGLNSYAVFAEYDPYTRDSNSVASPTTAVFFSLATERGVTASGTG